MDLKINAFQPGYLTFNAEGNDSGKFFSRAIHWPGGKSGVTIGRGYDMGVADRSANQIISDLTKAGVPLLHAQLFSKAAGLKGSAAQDFVAAHKGYFPQIEQSAQEKLFFDILKPRYEDTAKRLATKADVTAKYGATDWGKLDPRIKEVIFDLTYRGDYTPSTRETLQPLIVKNDVEGFAKVINDAGYWKTYGVPQDRFDRRAEFINGMLEWVAE